MNKADLKMVGLVAAGALLAIGIAGVIKKQIDKAATSAPAPTASTTASTAATATT